MSCRQIFVVSSVLSGLMLLAACGGDDSPPPSNAGGSSGSGGSGAGTSGGSGGGEAGGADSGGSTSGGSGGGSTSGGSGGSTGGAASDCTVVPENGNISDFTEANGWEPNTCVLGTADCEWSFGDSTSLTGGSLQYKDNAAAENPLTATADGETLNLNGTLPAGQYAGFGLWFGPACSDATAFTGIELTVSNSVVPMPFQLQFQAQMSSNYPIDTVNNRGTCEYTDEANKWTECSNNYFNIEEVGDTAAVIQIPFTELAGGTPNPTFNAGEIMGIQLQFNCAAEADCPVDLTVDEVRFY